MKAAFILFTTAFLAGCASTNQFIETPTSAGISEKTARISLERVFEFGGSATSFAVMDDGLLVGEVAVGGKLLWDRPAGESCLDVRSYLLPENRLCFRAVGGVVNEVRYRIDYGLYVLKIEQQLQNKTIIKSN